MRQIGHIIALFFFGLWAQTAWALDIGKQPINLEAEEPSECFTLSAALKFDVDYRTFLTLERKGQDEETYQDVKDFNPVLGNKKLCLKKLRHGASYKVTFLKYFPVDGEELSEDKVLSFTVGDRTPSAKFEARNYILPSITNQKVPVTLVNTTDFTVRAYRLSDAVFTKYRKNHRWLSDFDGYDVRATLEGNDAEIIGQQHFSVKSVPNKTMTYNLDVTALTQNKRSGAYVLVLGSDKELDESRWTERPTQFLLISDLGASLYWGSDGVGVYIRSYETAEFMPNVTVSLYGYNKEILETQITDENGYVHFSQAILSGKAGRRPHRLAYHAADHGYGYLSLRSDHVSLSKYNISGRPALRERNATLYTERGVYRAGEQAVLTGIIRNKDLTAGDVFPFTLRISKPDGSKYLDQIVKNDQAGAFQYRFDIPATAATGQWSASLYLNTEQAALVRTPILVEDYVPQTIETKLSKTAEFYGKDPVEFKTEATFNYGAPAAGLKVQQEYRLKFKRHAFAGYSKYVFGTMGARGKYGRLPDGKTSEDGSFTYDLMSSDLPEVDASSPMELTYSVAVLEPNGRAVRKTVKMPYRLAAPYWTGVKDDASYYDKTKPIKFSLVQLDRAGTPVAGRKIAYRIVKETRNYRWYRDDGWKYRIETTDSDNLQYGYVTFDPQGQASIDVPASNEWGHYRLELMDTAIGQTTTLSFTRGWWGSSSGAKVGPDRLQMALSKENSLVGEKVDLRVEAPYDGKLQVLVASDKILERHVLDVKDGAATLSLKVKKEWGTGAYMLASLFRPVRKTETGIVGPARAIGINYVKVDRPDLRATLQLEAPEKIRPNQDIKVKLSSDSTEDGYAVLALVDEGILSLTGFKTPDPLKFYLAKQHLRISMFGTYAHLVQFQNGEVLKLSFGGDGAAAKKEATPPKTFVEPFVYVSPLTKVLAGETTDFTVPVPQFNGAARWMVLYVDPHKIGQAEQKMVVRDSLVVQPILPRFLSVTDKGDIGLDLNNVEAPAGAYKLHWTSSPNFTLSAAEQTIDLKEKEHRKLLVSVEATQEGEGFVAVTIDRPDGEKQVYRWTVTATWTRPEQYKKYSIKIPAQGDVILPNFLTNLQAENRRVTAKFTNISIPNVDYLLWSLTQYPFGCVEQTTSRLWPVLLYSAKDLGWSEEKRSRYIKDSFDHLQDMQLVQGGFSLWAGGRSAEEWGSFYALDAMIYAKEHNIPVPEEMYKKAVKYLTQYEGVKRRGYAYSLYLKAKLGLLDVADLEYYATYLQKQESFLRSEFLFAALAFNEIGDAKGRQEMADFAATIPIVDGWRWYSYGSYKRNKAMALFERLQSIPVAEEGHEAFYEEISDFVNGSGYRMGTQTKGWLVRLGGLLQTHVKPSDDLFVMKPSENARLGAQQLADEVAALSPEVKKGFNVQNTSDHPLYVNISASGQLKGTIEASEHNLFVDKKIVRLSDKKEMLEGDVFEQGEDYLVTLEIKSSVSHDMELSLLDPVPAGFEIENPKIAGGRDIHEFAQVTSPNYQAYRDDKFMAVWSVRGDFGSSRPTIKAAYLMKAVTTGDFYAAPTVVEDMYQPINRAITAETRRVIQVKNDD